MRNPRGADAAGKRFLLAHDLRANASRLSQGKPLHTFPDHALANDVRQQTEETRALDGARELALLLGGHRCDAARHDLAALGDVTHQQLGILVVDLRRVRTRERTGLAAAEKRTACTGFSHGSYSSSVVVSA